ncbi:MAG: CBS domain-containing protein [Nitrospirae bacterium]|nr:CBS domain-containing protein [Nitrospirota bacterium]
MEGEMKVRDFMTPIEEYPHIPHSSTIEEALVELRSVADRGYRHILVFDERFHLVAFLSLRDLLKSVEPGFFRTTCPQKYEGYCPPDDASLAILWQNSFLRDCKKKMQKPLSEILDRPVKIITVEADDPVLKAIFLMLREDINALPVIERGVVVGVIRLVNILNTILKQCD